MAAKFSSSIAAIVAAENGYTDSGSDYGGETKYGISKREYPNLDIKNLSLTDAMDIIEKDYWNRYRLNEIDDQETADLILLLFINMNPLNAATIVQKAINVIGFVIISVKVDGVMGSKTIAAINRLAAYWLNDRMRLESCRYYLNEVDKDAQQIPNFRGWIRRALR